MFSSFSIDLQPPHLLPFTTTPSALQWTNEGSYLFQNCFNMHSTSITSITWMTIEKGREREWRAKQNRHCVCDTVPAVWHIGSHFGFRCAWQTFCSRSFFKNRFFPETIWFSAKQHCCVFPLISKRKERKKANMIRWDESVASNHIYFGKKINSQTCRARDGFWKRWMVVKDSGFSKKKFFLWLSVFLFVMSRPSYAFTRLTKLPIVLNAVEAIAHVIFRQPGDSGVRRRLNRKICLAELCQ